MDGVKSRTKVILVPKLTQEMIDNDVFSFCSSFLRQYRLDSVTDLSMRDLDLVLSWVRNSRFVVRSVI